MSHHTTTMEDHHPPQLPPELTELNLITLNCWGLLHLSQHRAARLQAIGQSLASAHPTPHVVCLQEVWTQEDYRAVRRETRYILPYGKFYHGGAFGAGLAILSRWPIEESSMVRYPLNGRPTAFWRGDWYVGKGVACAKIRWGRGRGDVIEVFNTHTHARYEKKDSYQVHRLSQAWELSKLIRGAAARGHLALAMGDLNDAPQSLPYRILTAHAPVRDVWRVLHPDSSLGAAEDERERARRRPIPSALFNVLENGATSNSVYNTWRWSRRQRRLLGRPGGESVEVPPDALDGRGKRLDYIFMASGEGLVERDGGLRRGKGKGKGREKEGDGEGDLPDAGWVVENVRVGMMERHPVLHCSLSDHFSVEATLILHKPKPRSQNPTSDTQEIGEKAQQEEEEESQKQQTTQNTPPPAPSVADSGYIQPSQLTAGVYLESPSGSEVQIPTPSPIRPPSSLIQRPRRPSELDAQLREPPTQWLLPSSSYDDMLGLIRDYTARERFQRRWRAVHCVTWVVVTLVCWVGVWWAPSGYVAFVLMLLSSLGLAAGVVDGLVALLFVGEEMRALREFEWEVLNAKAVACGVGGWRLDDEEKQWL